jgi:hypothetical protein
MSDVVINKFASLLSLGFLYILLRWDDVKDEELLMIFTLE